MANWCPGTASCPSPPMQHSKESSETMPSSAAATVQVKEGVLRRQGRGRGGGAGCRGESATGAPGAALTGAAAVRLRLRPPPLALSAALGHER